MPMPTIQLAAVTLPGDLLWVDEFDWTPVLQQQTYALDGALMVEHASRLAGRPITLQGAEDQGWVTRATLVSLYALAQAPSTGLPLTLSDGSTRLVVFRHDQIAIEARPILRAIPDAGSYYQLTLRLMEV